MASAVVPLFLLAAGVHAAQADSAASDYQNQIGPSDSPAGAAASNTGKRQGQKEDILDRAFTPFDDAVSDINRTINKKGDDKAGDPGN